VTGGCSTDFGAAVGNLARTGERPLVWPLDVAELAQTQRHRHQLPATISRRYSGSLSGVRRAR
jgi:hypothetical protein